MIAAVAVIGKRNNPLYLRGFGNFSDSDLQLHQLSYMSLDIVYEKLSENKNQDNYLGLMIPTDQFNVFGYVTNTNVKFVVITMESFENDAVMQRLLASIHGAYLDAVSNPFLPMESELAPSKRFDKTVSHLVASAAAGASSSSSASK